MTPAPPALQCLTDKGAAAFFQPLTCGDGGIGAKVTIAVLERDPRCQMITLDPDTAPPNPAILRRVVQAHDGMAGVYAAVLAEGTIRRGDPVEVLE